MAVYSVEGKLGTGKTKFAVWRAQLAMEEGRRVASNVDLKPWLMCPRKRISYVRIPDKPTSFDLESIGHGNPDSYDEDKNGVLILDELGTWLNSRSFQDKDRAHLLDWLIHARKLGWDVYLIVQDAGMIDKQVREALIEYSCRCMRMDKVKIPLIGSILCQFHKRLGYLPKFHMVAARLGGNGAGAIVAERWAYRGVDLHACYDTRQIFRADYPYGAHSELPPWDFNPQKGWLSRLRSWWTAHPMGFDLHRQPKPKPRIVQLIQQLPNLDDRVYWLQRWLALSSERGKMPLRLASLSRPGPVPHAG